VAVRPALRQAWQRLRGGELTPRRAALSVGVGLAIGLVPVYGAHWAIVLAVCVPLKLDAPVAYLAANISNPFFAPFLLLAEVQLGSQVMTGARLPLTREAVFARGPLAFLWQTIVGVAILAPLAALVVGALTYGIASFAKKRREKERREARGA
jgi:uncharacterized protein (DUF2062 family)